MVNEVCLLEQMREMKHGESSSRKRKSQGNLNKNQVTRKGKRTYQPLTRNQKPQEIVRAYWKCNKNHLARECLELRGKCYHYGETGHMARQCQSLKDIRCFYYGQLDHSITNCQARAQGKSSPSPSTNPMDGYQE